jgi:hypothetical protein
MGWDVISRYEEGPRGSEVGTQYLHTSSQGHIHATKCKQHAHTHAMQTIPNMRQQTRIGKVRKGVSHRCMICMGKFSVLCHMKSFDDIRNGGVYVQYVYTTLGLYTHHQMQTPTPMQCVRSQTPSLSSLFAIVHHSCTSPFDSPPTFLSPKNRLPSPQIPLVGQQTHLLAIRARHLR